MNKREIKLKAIKPGMIIHCKNDEEKKVLLEEADRLGYKWNTGLVTTDCRMFETVGTIIHFCNKNNSCDFLHIVWSDKTDGVTEFSDLIVPELTAEEVLQIATDICNISDCDNGCPLAAELDDFTKQCMICPKSLKTYSETVPIICQQWKSEHERKEPEIETVDICRIIEMLPNGSKRCVHEEDIKPDPELPFGSEQIAVEEILKHYCIEHDGKYIAVHEVISRVKSVN
ncbi:MAG: hypothetical protein ACI4DK_12720 [Lachnospiraceae bacterium]